MRIAIIIGILLLAVAATVAMFGMREQPPRKEAVELAPLVEVMTLEPMSARFTIRSQGTVLPRTETVLSAEVSGTIISVSPKFIAGGVFAGDEVLMRIDPTNYKVALDQAQALVKQRQIEFDGTSKLRSQGYRAEAEYASAAAALASARAELVRARRNLERTYIRLPYAGIVRTKEVDVGQFVNPGTRLGVAFATDFAEVRLPLTDADLAFVDLPDAADIASSGAADGPLVTLSATRKGQSATWPARITRTEGIVDEKSRVTYAVARIDDPYQLRADGLPLPIGTFVSASITGAEADNVMRVPRSLVRGTNELVFATDDNRIDIRPVEIVRSDSEFVYIRDGAEPGDRVITTTLETPINGMQIRIPDTGAAAAHDTSPAGQPGGDDA
jgi:RND family efflux transporter MFP subunit